MTAPVDWSRWRKCPICHAGIGDACTDLTGRVVNGRAVDVARVLADVPHSRRKPRTGGTT